LGERPAGWPFEIEFSRLITRVAGQGGAIILLGLQAVAFDFSYAPQQIQRPWPVRVEKNGLLGIHSGYLEVPFIDPLLS
jgi:hypothetical protein